MQEFLSVINILKVMEPIIDYLKENIKYYRSNKGWSQQELAEKSDVSTSYIAEIELGRRNPSLNTLLKIATGLGIETYQLFVDRSKHENQLIKKFSDELVKRIEDDIEDLCSRL